MAIKRSGDGVHPPYLDKTNKRDKVAPIPLPPDYATVLAGSPGPSNVCHEVADGPTYSTATFHRRKGK